VVIDGILWFLDSSCGNRLRLVVTKMLYEELTSWAHSEPFKGMGLDILKMLVTDSGNRYVVVFLDYLTKWVEAFPLPDQMNE